MIEWFKTVWSRLVRRERKPAVPVNRTVDPLFVKVSDCGFPPDLQKAIFETSRALALGLPITADLTALRANLAQVDPAVVHTAARDISVISGFWHHRVQDRVMLFISPLTQHPDLAWLWMFDGNGHIREASLKALSTPPQSPFECASIAYRMNDWAPQVRLAARTYAAEFIPLTQDSVIAASAEYLLTRLSAAQRWDSETRQILETRIYDPSVLAALTEQIRTAKTGRVGRLLRHLLRRGEMDPVLNTLATGAKLPLVRAIAAQALISGRVRWSVGSKRQWIDKTMGQSRTVPVMTERLVGRPADVEDICPNLAKDKSAIVRRSVAFTLTEVWRSGGPVEDEIAATLASDSYPSIRSYAEFYLRKRRERVEAEHTPQVITSAQSL